MFVVGCVYVFPVCKNGVCVFVDWKELFQLFYVRWKLFLNHVVPKLYHLPSNVQRVGTQQCVVVVPRETSVSHVLLLTKKTGEYLPPFFRKEFHGIFNSSILYT